MHSDAEFHLQHSSHDVVTLMERWSSLAEQIGIPATTIGEDGDHAIVGYASGLSDTSTPNIYLSAGVHGDEPAPLWGLLHWAEKNLQSLLERNIGFMILPCMNPVGITLNTRHDSAGRDLNRMFEGDLPLLKNWREFVGDTKFRLGLQLHEDYDGCGIYIYEIDRHGSQLGDACLAACESIIPRDPRDEIDESPFKNGILNRSANEDELHEVTKELNGWPEALYLFLKNTEHVITFESPSEFALSKRILTHKRFLESAIAQVTS